MNEFFSNSIGRSIAWFGLEHLIIIMLFLISMGIVFFSARLIKKENIEKKIRIFLIIFVFIFEYRVFIDRALNHSIFRIPLCGIALYLLTYSMIFKSKRVFNIAYFYAFGTVLTFLFFDTPYALDRFNGWTYFGAHAMIGVLVVYGVKVLGFIPSKKDLMSSILILGIYSTVSGYATFRYGGSDELFLKNPPVDFLQSVQSISQFLYTFTIILIALICIFLMYLPLRKYNKKMLKAAKQSI